MQRTQIYLEEDSHRRLRRMAAQRHATVSHMIREAVAQYVARESGTNALAALERVRGIWADRPEADLSEVLRERSRARLRALGLLD